MVPLGSFMYSLRALGFSMGTLTETLSGGSTSGMLMDDVDAVESELSTAGGGSNEREETELCGGFAMWSDVSTGLALPRFEP
jgi:hypothetical protein